MRNSLPLLLIAAIWSGATTVAILPLLALRGGSAALTLVGVILIPMLFIPAFGTIAGLLSRLAQRGIVPGKFPREPLHPVYLLRRVYGTCWTQVFYFKPVYSVILAIPILKRIVFRLFGYKGSDDFTVYPDTWIRDLPLLSIGAGCYLANRSTVATNMCLIDGSILVDRVCFGEQLMLGHLAVVGPGARLGDRVEIGVASIVGAGSFLGDSVDIGPGTAIGIKASVDCGVRIGPRCAIDHGALFHQDSSVGSHSYIGTKAEIGPRVSLPAGTNVPAGAKIMTQADVDELTASEIAFLERHKSELLDRIASWTAAIA